VVNLCLLVVKAALLLNLGVVLRLIDVQTHLGRNAEVADGEKQQFVDDGGLEFLLLLLLVGEFVALGLILLCLDVHEIANGVVLEIAVVIARILLLGLIPNLEGEVCSLQYILMLLNIDVGLEFNDFHEEAVFGLHLVLLLLLLLQQTTNVGLVKGQDTPDIPNGLLGGSHCLLVVVLLAVQCAKSNGVGCEHVLHL
jgi:hypothetical protein